MIWFLFGVMLLAAALFVAWPLWRREQRLSPELTGSVAVVLALSAGLYAYLGTPVPPTTGIDAMMASLEQRLAERPENLDGWKLLARSHMQLGNYGEAIRAYERAVELESASNPQTLANLGEAVLNGEPESITGRAGELFENALALAPGNPKALFYGGIAALERGDSALAADRWEALLAQSPPPEIEAILRERVAVWRGGTPDTSAGSVVQVDVSLSADADAAVGPEATVYIIARDPAQPSPPIAAVRRKASELPLTVALGDGDSMIPGRLLSSYERLEIVARASLSGNPMAQSGDWYGQQTVTAGASEGGTGVAILIERRVE